MSKDVTPLDIEQVRISAHRLGKEFPEIKHMRMLDLCAHAFLGVSSYHEAVRASQSVLIPQRKSRVGTMESKFGHKPTIRRGDWCFYPEQKAIVFEGEFSPFVVALSQINSSGKLLHMTLQVHKKRWPKEILKNNDISPTYQADEFLQLIGDLCQFYFEDSIQDVYCPTGEWRDVDWDGAIEKKRTAVSDWQ